MKAQTKAALMSLVVIALALCAVSGATYSWFSDTEEAEIDITTGAISLDMETCSIASYYHVGNDIVTDAGTADGVTISKNNDSQFSITVSGMAPCDVLVLNFTGGLTNTIDAVLLFNTDVSAPAGLSSPFTIVNEYTVGGSEGVTSVPAAKEEKSISSTVTITMANVGNEYNGVGFTIGLNFSAYQSNTPGSDLPQDSMINSASKVIEDADIENEIEVPTPADSNISDVSLKLPAGSVNQNADIKVSAVSGATNEDVSYVAAMEKYGSIIGGVNVSGVETLNGESVSTIKFTIDGDYSGSKLAVYHEGEKLTYVDSTPSQNGQFTTSCDSETGITTVTICASEFSTYYAVSVDAVASVGGVNYYSLKEAFAAGGDITLLRNLELTNENVTVPKGVNVDLNLNGYGISGISSSNKNAELILVKGILAIEGSGTITYKHIGNNLGWNAYSSVISVQQASLTIKDGPVIKHLGGTNMVYAVDVLTNGGSGDASLTMNGGLLESPYRAIRLFANSTSCTVSVNISGGEVISTMNSAIWIQSSNSSINKAELSITGGVISGDRHAIHVSGGYGTPNLDVTYTNGELECGDSDGCYQFYFEEGSTSGSNFIIGSLTANISVSN